ncbi:MAG: helix-turn-helix domain-containing protein [Treponemataceae bacterium]|nr:helix-turn-helix domain-containing protein [Treponemataceae bacterium]
MLGEKILEYRKKGGMSQENLAEKLKVTRQTVSNWENGETAPNPDQLKVLSAIFNISIDTLLENEAFAKEGERSSTGEAVLDGKSSARNESEFKLGGFEYKSKAMIRGLPLIHINLGGTVPRRAKGIIAIGDIAQGVVALGGVSMGMLAIGGVSTGLVSIGGLAVGLLVALGGAAIAPVALGAGALGVVACGAGAVGFITNM